MATASTSTKLCSASVSYKKLPGTLSLTNRALAWRSSSGGSAGELLFANSRLNALFSSKEGGAKVMLRVAVLPSSASAPQIEETHNFTFIAASSSISDREHFKKALSTVIAENRERAELSLALPADPVGPEGASRKGKERADNSAVDSATKSFQLRKLVLTNNPALVQLHRNLVMSGDISEAEFWEGREDLLKAAEVDDEQKRGRSGEMVDPRPETSESGEVTVKITPALIREIFEEYPAVLQAYHDNVPSPLDEQQFWTRYFQSKLFNRNRTTNRAAVNTIKDDIIFDQYLGEEDDDIEPKNLKTQHIYRLLDLAATEDDQHEVTNQADVTMRAGGQRASLPLMRRFNEHSERLLNQSLGSSAKRLEFGIDPGNAGERNSLYDDILLEDLNEATSTDRIMLDLGDRTTALQGAQEVGRSEMMDTLDREKVVRETKESFEFWEPNLGEFHVDREATNDAVDAMMTSIRTKVSRASRDSHSSNGGLADPLVRQLVSLQASTNEYLRLFWSAVLPPKAGDTSAMALATPTMKAAKAERMIGYLGAQEEKMVALVQRSRRAETEGEIADRIEAALQPVMEALKHALEFYKSRTS